MHLDQWARRHNISPEALDELRAAMGCLPVVVPHSGGSEAAVQAAVRLEAAKKGVKLWRNNVGVLSNEEGGYVRYGLANDSKRLNEAVKSSDLIRCRDGKYRPVEPGTFPLAHGVPNRVGALRGYGNAIVPQVAADFIEAYLETITCADLVDSAKAGDGTASFLSIGNSSGEACFSLAENSL